MTIYGLFNDGDASLDARKLRLLTALLTDALGSDPLSMAGGVRMGANAPTGLQVATGVSGLTVTVQPGMCVIPGAGTAQGAYTMVSDAVTTVTLDTADGSQARYDRIVAKVTDTGSSSTTYEITKVTGTPAASPSIPATPSNALSLGTVLVPAGAATPGVLTVADTRTVLHTTLRPYTGFSMFEQGAFTATTTSTSLVVLLRSFMIKKFSGVRVYIQQSTPSGTTGEIKMLINGTQVGNTENTAFGVGNPVFEGPAPGAVGAFLDISIQARVVTGAGPIGVRFINAFGY